MAAEAETESVSPAPPPGVAGSPVPGTPEGDAAARDASWDSPEMRFGFLVAVSASVFAVDQATKAVIKANMQLGEVIPLLPPVLDLHFITNRGVAFGLFTRFGDVFVPIALVIMGVIVAYYRTLRGRRLWLRAALALQLGGAMGNLLDRLRYGAVVDFLDFHIDAINFHWPIFNVADSAIVVGVGILLVCLTTQGE